MTNSTNYLIIMNISCLNKIIKSLKPNGGRSMKKGFLSMWTTKCGTLMQLLLQKLNEENGVGTHYFTSSQQFPLCGSLPPPSLGHITTMKP
jgi:hypothetical protein